MVLPEPVSPAITETVHGASSAAATTSARRPKTGSRRRFSRMARTRWSACRASRDARCAATCLGSQAGGAGAQTPDFGAAVASNLLGLQPYQATP